MIEIIQSFALPNLLAPQQSGEIRGQYLTRRGACNLCGKCCTNIYLVHDEKPIETVDEFETLKAENPEYRSFTPIDETEHGLRFRCGHLTPENRCGIYGDRPDFCQKYPSEKGILLGGALAEGCGYSFEPVVSFREVLGKASARKTPVIPEKLLP